MDFSTVKQNLQNNGFSVSVFSTAKDAATYLNGQINGVTVGFGGSMTVKGMGLYDSLSTHNECLWHWNIPKNSSREEILTAAQTATVYISSVNGLAETGEIINIDGTCNRVSAMLFGHKKVYFIVGKNKLADSYEKALFRARNVAAPMNAKRLSCDTPCAEQGNRCFDCQSPDRICRALSVIWKKPSSGDFEVVLVDEELGY